MWAMSSMFSFFTEMFPFFLGMSSAIGGSSSRENPPCKSTREGALPSGLGRALFWHSPRECLGEPDTGRAGLGVSALPATAQGLGQGRRFLSGRFAEFLDTSLWQEPNIV